MKTTMVKIQIEGEEVHLSREEDPVKPTHSMTMRPRRRWPFFLMGLVLGAMLCMALMSRYSLHTSGPDGLRVYRVDRFTGTTHQLDQSTKTWVEIKASNTFDAFDKP